jgi:hypothetical protein
VTPDTHAVASSSRAVAPTGCCPRFDPRPWDGRAVVWKDKLFVKLRLHSVLHVPLDMGRKVVAARALIDAAGAAPAQPLMLVDELSPWRAEAYVEVTRPVAGAEMASLSGTFLTKVFEGPYRDAPSWAAQMAAYVAGSGRRLAKLYFGYTTCPACAKAYGENYVVMVARVDEESAGGSAA